MYFKKRLQITLLELLIVMAILAMVSGVVMVSINKAIVDQRFRSEVSRVVDTLRLAQDLMVILGADVKVVFQEKSGHDGIEYFLDFDTLLPVNVKREVSKRVKNLKTIKGVFFVDETFSGVEKGKLELNFFSNGSMMSRGVLRLASSDRDNPGDNVLQNFICLPGYPRPINSQETKELAEKDCKNPDTGFSQRMTEDTWQRLPEKVKKSKKQDEILEKDPDDKNKNKQTPQNTPNANEPPKRQ